MRNRLFAASLAIILLVPQTAGAHCDAWDGPVVTDAKLSLEKRDVVPALKWVRTQDEDEVRQAFQRTLDVRKKNKEAKALADQFFFETVVRLHRAGEGQPYTGLKPAGLDPGAAVREADAAIREGSVYNLTNMATSGAAIGLHERFTAVMDAQKHANENVEAGRTYVKAYEEFVDYVERLHADTAIPREEEDQHEGPDMNGPADF